MEAALIYIARCLILILATWFICSFLGKKSLAQFTPYDIAILFIISNVVSQPLVNKDTVKTSIGIIILALSVVVIARLSLHPWFYHIDGSPSMLIERGQINEHELKKNHINLYILLSMLRIEGYYNVSDVYYAILEPGGQLSVLPKSSARPANTEEIGLKPVQEGLSHSVIIDGKVNMPEVEKAGITQQWLIEKLKKSYHVEVKEVLYGEVDTEKQLYVSTKR